MKPRSCTNHWYQFAAVLRSALALLAHFRHSAKNVNPSVRQERRKTESQVPLVRVTETEPL